MIWQNNRVLEVRLGRTLRVRDHTIMVGEASFDLLSLVAEERRLCA
jgi:hypothetical protein